MMNGLENARMGAIKSKKGYLIFAILSFILSVYGFAGMLEGRGENELNPMYAGIMCFCIGCLFLYFYFSKEKNTKL